MTTRETAEIIEVTDRAMTVRHIIEALEGADPDAHVLFVCNYGDYHNTQQALPVAEIIEDLTTANLKTSAYSQSGLALIEDDRDEEDEDEPQDEDEDEPQDEDEDEEFPVVVFRM